MTDDDIIETFEEYQEATDETAIYPDELPDWVDPELVYVVLGLQGEAGEVAEKLKKAIREDDPSYLDGLEDELGDTLWYLARTADELGVGLGEIGRINMAKLLDRKDRDALTGEGDIR